MFTPIGPLNFVLSQNLSKMDTDKTETFRFQIGTSLKYEKFKDFNNN